MKITEKDFNTLTTKCYEERYNNDRNRIGLKLFSKTRDCICLEATLGRDDESMYRDEGISWIHGVNPVEDGVYMTKIIRMGGIVECRINVWRKYGNWMIHSCDGAIVIAYRELSRHELNELFPEHQNSKL